jgi:hypothetical protein
MVLSSDDEHVAAVEAMVGTGAMPVAAALLNGVLGNEVHPAVPETTV